MINLIPPEGHKKARREYLARVVSALNLLFGGVALCLAVALFPTYILISTQTNVLSVEMGEDATSATARTDAENEVKRIQKVTTQLRNASSTHKATALISQVELFAPKEIIFKNIGVDNGKGGAGKLQIQGIAPTREALAGFKSKLESSDLFSKVEIPIADLARDKDLPFSLTITTSKPK